MFMAETHAKIGIFCHSKRMIGTTNKIIFFMAIIVLTLFFVAAYESVCLSQLRPDQILLVVNKNYKPGINVALYYASKRGIPPENMIELTIPTQEAIDLDSYKQFIEKPLYEAIMQPGWSVTIRCLVLFPGVPLRITSPKASVDSELALLRFPSHKLDGWISNPLYKENLSRKGGYQRDLILLVSRIDGPDIIRAKRIIDDSVETEQKGLRGVAYFDARYPKLPETFLNAYQTYDLSLRKAAYFFKKSGCMPVVLNTSAKLFQPGECPAAALYCGWYSLRKYVDAFEWKKGAVAYHIASGECTSLKKENSEWCRMLLIDGVAATLGPVAEPYLQAFPPPEIFFPLLATGKLTLVEAYFASLPFLSWRMVLIGDPLYMPFKKTPCIGAF